MTTSLTAIDASRITGDYSPTGAVDFSGASSVSFLTGTWTPVMTGSTVVGTNVYSTQEGTYTKVGDLVTIECRLIVTTLNSTGSLEIIGLPFVPASNNAGASFATYSGMNFASGHNLYIQASTANELRLKKGSVTSVTNVADTETSGTITLQFSMIYKV